MIHSSFIAPFSLAFERVMYMLVFCVWMCAGGSLLPWCVVARNKSLRNKSIIGTHNIWFNLSTFGVFYENLMRITNVERGINNVKRYF